MIKNLKIFTGFLILIIINYLMLGCVMAEEIGNNEVNKDSVLKKIQSSLPANWNMSEKNGELIIERNDFVWVLFENKINAPVSRETEQDRIERIKKFGKKTKAQFVFKYEPKWSDKKIQQIKDENDSIYKQIKELPEKHNITYLYNKDLSRKGGEVYIGTNQEEEKRIEDYKKEKDELEQKIKKLPDCFTSKYSLFLISKVGNEDEFYTVYPQKVSEDMYKIQNSINELCDKN